jgi:hypothetical protein
MSVEQAITEALLQTPVFVTFRDRATGKTGTHRHDHTIRWWTEGNGGCDCNRSEAIDDSDDALDVEVPCSSNRYEAIAAKGDALPESLEAWAIEEINSRMEVWKS